MKVPIPKTMLWMVTSITVLFALIAAPTIAEDKPGFDTWIADLRKEAMSKGISQTTLNRALDGLQPIPRVVELDRQQPEITLTLEEYLARVVSDRLVSEGREKLQANLPLLSEVFRRYGVQPRFLVALWGIESNFGRLSGSFPVIGAVATLAYDGRRSSYFRRELLEALAILDKGHISFEEMKGSWAGAMGQIQFMPSSFQRYALDHDGDGHIDIWNDLGDIFASASNYLASSGWAQDQLWGREVRLPKSFKQALLGLETRKPVAAWLDMGVRPLEDLTLSEKADLPASIVVPDGPKGRAFLVYHNYRVILKWNRSLFFGVAVGTLADRIGSR